MNGLKPSEASVKSLLKNEAEKAIGGCGENIARMPMPTRIVITVRKKNSQSPPDTGNLVATVDFVDE
jgi:hypothetical protein